MSCESVKSSAAVFRGKKPFVAPGTASLESKIDEEGCVQFLFQEPSRRERRRQIIAAYMKTLEACSYPLRRESLLPFPKEQIERAIWQELEENPELESRNALEIAYAHIDSFLPAEELELIENFKRASLLVQEKVQSGTPKDIIASARMLKKAEGERAVSIHEKISERIVKKFKRIREIGAALHRASPCHRWS
jgi:hypothetical protein